MARAAKKFVAENDGLLTVCVGSSRKTKVWKKKTVRWSQLVAKLADTKRTPETQAQFFKLSKVKQDEIKDIGGFVAGELIDGKRTAMTTGNRQVLTLDADFADPGLWGMVSMLFGEYAICCYSTHKHTKEKPRLRLVIPLDRPVNPDEYQAVSRKVAERFGIDIFDDTTYQPHRLMYWPSTSLDGDFEFHFQDGPWISADAVLDEYEDWHDQSSWPVSSRQSTLVNKAIKKQEDPLEKDGLIGAFCRAYTIQEAINEFLPDVYEKCAGHNDRYTYKAGTSAGGAVVYDDKFLYSHHATDPCSMQLVNAFDLVRIHKYGDLDDNKKFDDSTKLQSWAKMMKLVASDNKVKAQQLKEKQAEIDEDFGIISDEEANQNFEWSKKLRVSDRTGKILPTRANIRIILDNDLRVKDTFGWDAFSQRIAILKQPSWREENGEKYWSDGDDSELRYLFETYYEIDAKQKIEDETLNCANRHSFHKVREYLNNLKWDGEKRMETLFIDYLGAEDTPFTRAATRKMLIAAVKRVMEPGCKFDNMVVLEGPQGIGKSYILKLLGKRWFNDSVNTVIGKDAYEQLRGAWIVEMAELAAMKKSEVESTKQFISKQTDIYRVAYGKRVTEFPRQNIFVGTTNEDSFLRDRTGNRRFWPIRVGLLAPLKSLWSDAITKEIDQVWAEAKNAYESGESVWLGKEMEQIAKEVQGRHTEENPVEGMLDEFLSIKIPDNWYRLDPQMRRDYIRGGDFVLDDKETLSRRTRICPLEVWVEMMGGDIRHFDTYHRKEVRDALNGLRGWHLYKDGYINLSFGKGYGQQRTFVLDGSKDDEVNIKHGSRNDL